VADDKYKSGRVTPKKEPPPPPGTRRARPARPARARGEGRRWSAPAKIGPFEKPDASKPIGQVGRRPSSPAKLFLFAAVYFGCGVASFFILQGTVGRIVGIVLIGLSLLWLRGALGATVRHNERRNSRSSPDD